MGSLAAPSVTISNTMRTGAGGVVSLAGTVGGAAGTTVEIYDGTSALGSASLDSIGGWTFVLSALKAGSYDFHAVASSPGGTSATAAATLPIVLLQPGENVASIVSASSAGTTFIFLPGVYNNLTITPKSNQTFIGEPGAVLSGSVPVTGWSYAGNYWSTSNFAGPQWGYGDGRNGLAAIPNDLQVDGKAYLRVGSLAEVGPGDFYYGNGRAYISDNPTGRTTSMLDTATAFQGGTTTGVTIKNLTIDNYASVAQHGAIEAENTSGWTLDNVTAVANHGAGAAAGSAMTINGGNYSGNGQTGIHAQNTAGLTINGITADGNNYAQYSSGWDAGGIKILTSTNVTVENSTISSNKGIGLWFDTDVANATVANNVINGNQGPGLQYEAAYSATISGNVLANNAQSGYVTGYWGSDLIIVSSSHVDATGNTLVVNDGAEGIGIQEDSRPPDNMGPHATTNNTVSKNTFVLLGSGKNGGASDGLSSSQIFNGSNVWNNNTYVAQNAQDVDFTWNNAYYWAVDPSQFLIDKNGTFTYVADPQAYAASLAADLPDTLDLHVSEDAWQGDAAFTVSINGTQIGGTRIVTASHAAGETQDVSIAGSWGAGPHTIGISFINDAYGGTPSTDRNLYVDQASYDGHAASGTPAALTGNGTKDFSVASAPVPTALSIQMAEDAWQGNAQYAIAIDGKVVSSGNQVTALNASGQSQAVNLQQALSAGAHDLAISFLNDAYGGTPATDRNLYIKGVSVDGVATSGASATLDSASTVHFQFVLPA